jgi:hypothetical protein
MGVPARCDVMYSFYGVRLPAQGGFDKSSSLDEKSTIYWIQIQNESRPESDLRRMADPQADQSFRRVMQAIALRIFSSQALLISARTAPRVGKSLL